ncbi:hypothetical protein ElyMa_000975600 [Elysia marginata]|uniref:Uncharacterized protein n=1 Tax=Elysia marginata TaxID=1093978 RepID=A0AAV4HGX3_9GAST|nr:hypothetical protein ElyMa_000975600 [Elysia marginata]
MVTTLFVLAALCCPVLTSTPELQVAPPPTLSTTLQSTQDWKGHSSGHFAGSEAEVAVVVVVVVVVVEVVVVVIVVVVVVVDWLRSESSIFPGNIK